MALIIMAVYDTPENGRSKYTKETIMCLRDTVDLKRHRVVISDNGSCDGVLESYGPLINAHIIRNGQNLGTARGVNQGLKLRKPGENCVKLDNDVRIHSNAWADEMEEAIERDPGIGVLGLKRKDLRQTPYDSDPDFRSELVQLPHESGQRWIVVERSKDIMGTCTMLNWRLLDKIGGYAQPMVYAFDDTLLNLRSILTGFYNAFLPHIEITHLDTGGDYSLEKQQIAATAWPIYHEWHRQYISGERPLWEEI